MSPAETWLEFMPAIPLARAVPVVDVLGDPGTHGVTVEQIGADGWQVYHLEDCVCREAGDVGGVQNAHLRVDLDDPQGFVYALRHYYAHPHVKGNGETIDVVSILHRWANSITTDADRLSLAKALREVS